VLALTLHKLSLNLGRRTSEGAGCCVFGAYSLRDVARNQHVNLQQNIFLKEGWIKIERGKIRVMNKESLGQAFNSDNESMPK
jgi:hypothetical protein